jgi:phytoene dehydrogenase-like protein
VRDGIWRVTEELGRVNRELGVDICLGSTVSAIDVGRGTLEYRRRVRQHRQRSTT